MNARLDQARRKLEHARVRAAFFRLGKVAMLIDDAIRLVDAEIVEQELAGLALGEELELLEGSLADGLDDYGGFQ